MSLRRAALTSGSMNDISHLGAISSTSDQALRLVLEKFYDHAKNQVVGFSGILSAPTTTSTQAAGTGATAWRVNVSALLAVVNGAIGEVTASADVAIHGTTMLLASNSECVAAICAYATAAGVITLTSVEGTAVLTTTGATGPTDTVITAQIGTAATTTWIKLGETKLARTTGTACTQTYDNTKRPVFGITVDETFWGTV